MPNQALIQIAAAAKVDPRTVARFLRGGNCKAPHRARIQAALREEVLSEVASVILRNRGESSGAQ